MRVFGSFRRASPPTVTGPATWPRCSRQCWAAKSKTGWDLPADPVPMRRFADHGEDAAAHAQAVRPDLLDRAASIGVAVGDEDVRAIDAGARRLDVVDEARAEQVRAAAALGPRLLSGRGFHHGSAKRAAARSDHDLHLAVPPSPLEVAPGVRVVGSGLDEHSR